MILVTGATGIVGHFITLQLLDQGHKVRAIKRHNSDTSRLAARPNLEWQEAELEDLTALKKAFEGVEYVVHCAAVVSFYQQDKQKMLDINVNGTANMVNLAIAAGVKKFIHISSVAAIGRKEGIDEIDENVKWEESKYNSNYGESKYLAELEVWRAEAEGLKSIILNPSIVIGPGDWHNSSMQIFKFINQGKRFYPTGEMNFVDVRDVADITCKMLFNELSGERFILNSGKEYYKKVFSLISQHLNKPAPRYRVSYTLLNFAYIFDTLISLLTGRRSIITKESLRLSKMSFFFSNRKITRELNYKFRGIEEAVSWTCEELKNMPMR